MFTPSSRAGGAALLAAIALVAGAVAPARAQDAQSGKTAKPAKKKHDVEDVFKKWIKEDVVYIISPVERDAFQHLATDEEREAFIDAFWAKRDPDPNTPENEYREEHYRRIAYANEHFSSGTAGWRTDRGRVYIAWGKPDEMESNPAGSTYYRQQYEGGGSTTTYAYETWWYRHLDGVGDGVELEFVDTTGTGDYRIALSPDEKDALNKIPGGGLNQWEQLGLSSKADRVNGGRSNFPVPESQTFFSKLQTWTDIQAGPGANVRFRNDIGADLPQIETNALPFAFRTDFYRQSETGVVTALTMQVDNSDLAFTNKGGVYEATVNVIGVITQLSGKGAGRFEDVIATPRYSDENLALGQQQKSAYQKNVLLPPGNYKIDIVTTDVTSGKKGVIRQSFVVPRFAEDKFGTSSIVLAQKIEPVTNRVAAGQFVVGRYKVIPNVASSYKPSQPIGVFFQVYETQLDQTYLTPNVDIEYVLTQNGKEVRRVSDHYPVAAGAAPPAGAMFDLAGSQLVVGRVIPSDGLAAGSYKLKVSVTDRVAQKTVSSDSDLTIAQ